MELTILAERWEPERGGRERLLHALAGRAAAKGIGVRVLCRRGDDGRDGVSVAHVSAPRFPRSLGEALFQRRAAALAASAKGPVLAGRPMRAATHAQLHDGLLSEAFEAERDAMQGPRRALQPLGNRLNARRHVLLAEEERMLSGPEPPRLMVFSHALAERLRQRYPGRDVTLATPGVDRSVFTPGAPPVPRPNLQLAFVGNDFALKGLATALQALRLSVEAGRDVRLTVAGTGPPRFATLARRLGLSDRVVFAGRLAPQETAALFRRSDALLYPTFRDTFGLVIAEALASGCPVITTSRSGAAERLEDGVNGYVVPDPRDAAAFARAIAAVADAGPRLRAGAARLGATFDARAHEEEVLAWLGLS